MVDCYVKLYKELAKLPIATKAFCRQSNNKLCEIVTSWEQRDVQRLTKTGFKKSYFFDANNRSTVVVSSPVELNNELTSSYSNEGLLAIVRKSTSKAGTDKQYIEIWKDGCKFKTLDVLSKEKHLNIITNAQFGCLKWSPSSTHLVYVAEKYIKTESYFASTDSTKRDQDAAAKIQTGEEFLYRQSWGEALQDIISPLLFTVNIETEEVELVPGLSDDISYGKACWTADGKGIVCVGWWHTPYKLGLIYCGNRRSAVFHIDIENKSSSVIGSSEHSVNEGPWFSPNGETLVYLQSEVGGPHRAAQALIKVDWATKNVTEVVKVISQPKSSDDFPGIYSLGLPERIWMDDNEHIVFHSIWRSKQELLCVNVKTSEVTRLTKDENVGERILLDCFQNLIIATKSSPNSKPNLVAGIFISEPGHKSIQWTNLNLDKTENSVNIDWRIFALQPPSDSINPEYPNLDYEAILLTPKDSSKQPHPLIVIPHGGPHGTICAFYSITAEFFCRLGCAILYVNYRGSLGFGQNNVVSLLGNIGIQDVKDCQFAVETALKMPNIDASSVSISSGSHGGYLALSLSGLYPDKYKSIVVRNPVVSVHDMVGISDIPDWSFAESGYNYDFSSVANSEMITKMWNSSPIRLVDKIRCPVLFLLGNADLRVPYHQGLIMHRGLKARNIETKVYVYNDNHALSHIDSEADCLVHIASWILRPSTHGV